MRRMGAVLLATLLACAVHLDAQARRPASPEGTAATQVDGRWIEIVYGRPILRGRARRGGALGRQAPARPLTVSSARRNCNAAVGARNSALDTAARWKLNARAAARARVWNSATGDRGAAVVSRSVTAPTSVR